MTRKPDRFERVVQRVAFLDSWNMPVVSAKDALKLLRAEHRRVVKLIRKRGDEYMQEASDLTLSKAMQASAASKAWAFKDFADEMAALTRMKGGRG